jgi:hypothetical protein
VTVEPGATPAGLGAVGKGNGYKGAVTVGPPCHRNRAITLAIAGGYQPDVHPVALAGGRQRVLDCYYSIRLNSYR